MLIIEIFFSGMMVLQTQTSPCVLRMLQKATLLNIRATKEPHF
jgi:hypothetical protein